MSSSKKKILFLITKSNWGGAQRYVYDLATALSHTHDVLVATGGAGRLVEKLSDAGVRTHSIEALVRDVHITKEFSVARQLFSLLRTEEPDIVHVNSSKAGGLGALVVRIHNMFSKKRARVIFTAHGWAFKEERPLIQKLVIGLASYLTVVFAHATIAVSADDFRRASWMPFVQKKLHTIHIGISAASNKDKNEARKELFKSTPLPKKDVLVGTIAELHRNKGLIHGLGAFEKLQENDASIAWVVIGEGEERAHLENLIRTKNLTGAVTLLGARSDAAELLPAFDIFLLPSIKEGLPYTVLEAGMAGLPVVATAVGGIPEVIQDMQSGILVRSKSADEIAGALSLLAENPEKRASFGAELKKNISSTYTFDRMLQTTKHLYFETPSRQSL